MSRLETLEREIRAMAPEELLEFERWFAGYKNELWDRQIEEDVQAGKPDDLAKEALRELSTFG